MFEMQTWKEVMQSKEARLIREVPIACINSEDVEGRPTLKSMRERYLEVGKMILS